ncbi:MAG: hypothetical protein A3F72_02265 [Bacteroidetes bacterium RIFCSPLOWO2_12_FULL_35_15]|nr:MAG: hypothetical protein A3F72_02265 [Bacteroidetes bacterium RIFCSPLOWO2_12_FULL_35_15]
MKNFEDLESWKLSRQLRNEIALLGYGRFHYQENIQFCRHSRGSLTEVLDHLICAYDCNYINENELNLYREKVSHILKILNGYISYLRKKRKSTYTALITYLTIYLIN